MLTTLIVEVKHLFVESVFEILGVVRLRTHVPILVKLEVSLACLPLLNSVLELIHHFLSNVSAASLLTEQKLRMG